MIVIPMAGLSSRFFKAGYSVPKYMLEAHGCSVFEHVLSGFSEYFNQETFVFIIRDVFDTKKFIEQKLKKLNINKFAIVTLKVETRGQAETVAIGLRMLDSVAEGDTLTIFNIDTFRLNFKYPNLDELGDGYLEVFLGDGLNWSYVLPESINSTKVIKTTEKDPISNLCCTGLYHFSSVHNYFLAYNQYVNIPSEKLCNSELYVAPMYNILIGLGKNIHYNLIDQHDVVFCGVPEEYLLFCNSGFGNFD